MQEYFSPKTAVLHAREEKGNGPKQCHSADVIVGPACKQPPDCHELLKFVERYLIDGTEKR